MNKIYILGLAFLISLASFAEKPVGKIQGEAAQKLFKGAEELYYKKELSNPIFISLKPSTSFTVSTFFAQLKEVYEIDASIDFVLEKEENDQIGMRHLRYRQYIKGIPIRFAAFILHLKENKVVSASGKFYSSLNFQSPQLSENEALQIALNDFGAAKYKWELPKEEAFLKKEQSDPEATYYPKGELMYFGQDASEKADDQKASYVFNIYAQEPLSRLRYYINVNDGSIVYIENLIHTGNEPATAHTSYSGVRPMITDSVAPNTYHLRESTRGNGVETYDLNNGTQYSQSVDFVDSDTIWDTFSPSKNRYATDAHWGTEMTYDYFFNIHGRNSIDNLGFTLRSYVHYSTNYVNAFWDGQRMTYGDGDATTNPLTTLDITGHEVTHGLTNFSSGLIYGLESGALNESFSDIFGVTVEQYARNGNWNWTMGEEIGSAFRSLSNPKAYGDPDTYKGSNWYNLANCNPTSGNGWCGVHTNSGVQNYWFYLLSEGGSGTNDRGDAYQVDSIGIIKASRVAFRNNTFYLTPSSDYEEARYFAFRSAVDLYGACSPEVEAVIDAWYAVGVGDPYSAGVSSAFVALNDTSFCSTPATVNFESDGSNVINFTWNFGDGTTSNLPDPTHVYTTAGNYTVQLIADGGACGTDTTTFTNYINIDTANACSFSMSSGYSSINACQGLVYDRGGLNGDYPVNGVDTLQVNGGGDFVQLNFLAFDLEAGLGFACNHDYVEIFDGPSVSSPSLGRFCNSKLPPPTILTSGSSFTLVFNSDGKVNAGGMQLSWNCITATALPQADFQADLDTTCNGFVQFKDVSTGGVSSRLWDFGDGNSSTIKSPVHRYQSSGNYTVKLTVFNSFGQDSVVKTNHIYVDRSNFPSVGGDSICRGEDAKLWANGTADLLWYNNLNSERAVHRGDTLRLSGLNNSQSYYVASSPPVTSQTIVPFAIGGNTAFTDTAEAIFFNVYEPILLETVLLRSNGEGFRRIDLRDKNGTVIASKNAFVPNSGIQVTLNFSISPDTNYSLSIGSREPRLMVNRTGASYPYRAGNYFEITGSTMGQSAYPFFYLFAVSPKRCESARKLVRAFVDTTCTLVGNAERALESQQFTFAPNPFQHVLQISGPLQGVESIRLYSLSGKLVLEQSNEGFENQMSFDLSEQAKGIYFVELRGPNILVREKVVKLNP